MSKPTPTRRRRPWRKALAVALVAGLVLLTSLPWLISAGPLRPMVDTGLIRALAPGKIRFEGLHLSWFGPTRLEKVVILDPKGEAVIKAGSMTLDRTLGQLILRDKSPVVLTLAGASFEVRRSEDGVLNIAEALRTILATPDPKLDLTIRVPDGSIRYRDPFLAEPAVADSVDLTIHAPYAPSPVTWSVKLGQGDAALECQGDFDAWLSKGGPPRAPDLQIGVASKRWPFVARTAGVDASARLDGSLDFARKRGRWVFSGDARLNGLNARGKTLLGDTLAFEKCEAGWDLAEGEDGWKIRRLSMNSPLGHLKAEGQLNGPGGSGKQRIEGVVDLAEIARQLPHALRLRDGLTVERGTARFAVDLASDPGQTAYDVEARVTDLTTRDHGRELALKDPATLTARFVAGADASRVERLAVHTAFLDASAQGRLEEGVELTASVDLDGLRKQLGEWVDLGGIELAGRGEIRGNYRFRPKGSPVAPISEWFTSRLADDLSIVADLPLYTHDWKATLKDLRVEGVGPWSIRRDSASLDFSASGDAGPGGLPLGWNWLGLAFASGKSTGRVDLQSRGGPIRLDASANSPVQLGDRPRSAGMKVSGELSTDRKTLALSTILAALNPGPGMPDASQVALLAKGRFDVSSGELTLDSLPQSSPGFLAIDPEGLRISGFGEGLGALRFDGGFSGELANLDALIADATGRAPLGLEGRWSAVANVRGDADGLTLAGKFGLVEPVRPGARPTRPTGLALRAHYSPQSDRLDLTEFTVSTGYGTLDASGELEEATGDAVVDLKGMVSPDFGAINAILAARVEPGAHLEGKSRPFRASGTLVGGSKGWKGLDAEVGFDLLGADVYGMKLGPTPVVLRAKRGQLAFDPISTTLNEGHVRLEPEIDLDAPGGPVLRLAKNSGIREARINDEVSKRVLAYVAPILDQATRASGLVSVDLDHAEFPIGAGRGRQVKVEGAVVFEDVEFAASPLAAEILGVIGRRDQTLKLDQPVTLTIADGRINQRGMSIPVGELTRIELSGWVDFDRNIALNATLPVTPAMLGNNPLLSDIAAGTKVRLPIAGTLDHPAIDRDAFTASMQELAKTLAMRGATRGAMELLMRLGRPKDPDAPPPPPRPTPEEKKAKRQEKKAIRRGEIPPPVENPRP